MSGRTARTSSPLVRAAKVVGYGLVVPLACALAERSLPAPIPSRFPLLAFVTGMCLASAFGGRAAGLAAVPLSALLAAFADGARFDPLVFAVAVLIGLVVAITVGSGREAQLRATGQLEARVAAEAAARDSRLQLEMALDAARVGYFSCDAATGAITWSRNLERLTGVPTGSLQGSFDAFLELVHPDDRRAVAEAAAGNLRSGTPYDIEFRVPRPDGGVRYMNGRGHLVRDAAGRPLRAFGFVVDVTDRHLGEEAQRWLAAIVESSEDAIIGQDADGRILSWNVGAERLFGFTAEEAIGKGASLIAPEGLEEDFDRMLERVRRGERLEHFETKRKRRDGAVRDVSLTVSPVRDASGRVVGLSKSARDVTDRAREERERERTREMFLGTLGHDLRNPLNTIAVSAQTLRRDAPPPSARTIDRILASTRRMSRMIDQLLDVTRSRLGGGMPVARRETDLFEICREVADELEAGAGHRFRIRREGPTTGRWDADRLAQAVGNLFGNALEHGDPESPVDVDLTGGDSCVSLRVANRGPAIPPELLPVLFDPFRSGRRSSGNGLGLGLYIAERIVSAHGGTIAVDSRPGETAFTVALPRGEEVAAAS